MANKKAKEYHPENFDFQVTMSLILLQSDELKGRLPNNMTNVYQGTMFCKVLGERLPGK